MIDFLMISARSGKNGTIEIVPKFIIKRSNDLMIRGGDFYAIWIEEKGIWSTDEDDALELIDKELDEYAKEYRKKFNGTLKILHMRDADSGSIDRWHKYCQKQMRDNFHMLDEKLIFSNTEVDKKDYASKRLPYPLETGDCPAFKRLISTLYSEEERLKIEWAIGSIVTGDSKTIQKFIVLYGAAGTGKSTILNIIQKLFEGYYSVFDAKALGSSSNVFALEAFKSNPLVAIQHDGDLSKIEDNTRLNSLVSHEEMTINEKFKSTYSNRFKAFLFMGTNRPVKITDAKSGLLRRLIDVTPSGNKLSLKDYKILTKQIDFELGAIANYCREIYLDNPGRYDDYVPMSMMGASNDFYNFVIDSYHIFVRDDETSSKASYEMYKTYCDDAKVPYPFSRRAFNEELKNYFRNYADTFETPDGTIIKGYYSGFRTDIFEQNKPRKKAEIHKAITIDFSCTESVFDMEYKDCPAQYATSKEIPYQKWENVMSKLSDLDTSKLHYVKVPENHIVVDFDIPDEDGNKCFEKNLEEASKWPATYAELSKSGAGIHLHYIYSGDASKLSRVYDDRIEIKVFTGNSSLRRKLTKCNNLPIATISSGLPLKEEDKVIDFEGLKNEKAIRTVIKRNLAKEYHPSTKCSIDFINKVLNDAYNGGMKYDVTDLQNSVFAFGAQSTNQSDYCIKLVNQMKFKSDEPGEAVSDDNSTLVFYDVEVFPNLFLVNWKVAGEDKPVVRMINPKPSEIEELVKFRLVGFNVRRYDNHMLYARLIGYTNEQLYNLSQKIINSKKGENRDCFFGEAYNISYTDIYDFASAGNKKSLKKLEIEMKKAADDPESKMDEYTRKLCSKIKHQELGLPWDKPVPEELWEKVAEYCDNDVISTEAAFHYLKGDWTARQILADITGMTVNDTTNSLSTRAIFGKNRKPQDQFNYRNLAFPVSYKEYSAYRQKFGEDYQFRVFNSDGLPEYRDYVPGEELPDGWSILPFFPGYKYEYGKSTYMGEEIGEGGRVYAEPGIYSEVWDADVTGQHPSSIIAEVLFGPKYTKAFKEIVDGRVSIKHQAWNDIDHLFDGKLRPYIQKVIDGELTVKELANAIKTVVNSVYGLTSASFENPFRDPRNVDNIVAKRGALFMTLLKSEVQKRGFTVAHIKTDSIKIPNATPEIKEFVLNFGKEYGYSFETEAEFDKFCLVNNAVYIAKTKDGEWTATGAQFAVPYVFKTLFSKKPIKFSDLCETKEVTSALYLDMNENLPDVSEYEKERDKLWKQITDKTKINEPMDEECQHVEELTNLIDKGHNYHFVGKIGLFCPIKPGCGGGELLREGKDKDGNIKYDSATGASGYRWLESEMVRNLGKQDDIDMNYYRKLVDDAVETISQYGDFEKFVSDDPVPDVGPWFKEDDPNDLPWKMDCGRDTCGGCQYLITNGCDAGYDNSDYFSKIDDDDLFIKR